MVNAQRGIEASCPADACAQGADKFRALYPDIDSELTMEYAEKIGLGSRKYKIEEV